MSEVMQRILAFYQG
nr:hypothetical protein [Escherichia coli]